MDAAFWATVNTTSDTEKPRITYGLITFPPYQNHIKSRSLCHNANTAAPGLSDFSTFPVCPNGGQSGGLMK